MRLETRAGRVVVAVLRVGLAAVFLYAAVPKLVDPAAFAQSVANYHLLPTAVVGVAARLVPMVELVVAGALLVGAGARGAALAAGLMLIVFIAAGLSAIVRGINIDCGCFGTANPEKLGWGSVARDLGLLLCCSLVLAASDASWAALLGRSKAAPRGPDASG